MPELIGPDDIQLIAEAALDVPGADSVEVLFVHDWSGLTRFADSHMHQNTWRENSAVRIRAVSGARIGVASTNDVSKDGAAKAARSAVELAGVAAPDPLFAGLAPRAETPERPGAFDEATATATPEGCAEIVASLVAECADGFHAAGAVEATASEVALANSKGQFCYAPLTQATISTVVSGGQGGAGFAEVAAPRLSDLDP
ncbi:MAG: PmbA/TldA family metallopeptidase, partial [Actinomycetota bacterium]